MHMHTVCFGKWLFLLCKFFLYDEFVKQLLVWKIMIVLENKRFLIKQHGVAIIRQATYYIQAWLIKWAWCSREWSMANGSEVQIYVYDLSMGLAAQLSPMFLGEERLLQLFYTVKRVSPPTQENRSTEYGNWTSMALWLHNIVIIDLLYCCQAYWCCGLWQGVFLWGHGNWVLFSGTISCSHFTVTCCRSLHLFSSTGWHSHGFTSWDNQTRKNTSSIWSVSTLPCWTVRRVHVSHAY